VSVGDNNSYARIGGSFEGVIDEVAVYAKVLPPDRIAAHYDAGKGN
jgi:hypothetical protein